MKHEHNLLSKSIVEATCEPEDSVHWIAHAAESAVVSVDVVAAVDPEQVVPSIGDSTEKNAWKLFTEVSQRNSYLGKRFTSLS